MPDNLGAVLRAARDLGYTVAWHMGIWDRKPPEPLTDEWIRYMENNSHKNVYWELAGDVVIAVRRGDGQRLRVYKVI